MYYHAIHIITAYLYMNIPNNKYNMCLITMYLINTIYIHTQL